MCYSVSPSEYATCFLPIHLTVNFCEFLITVPNYSCSFAYSRQIDAAGDLEGEVDVLNSRVKDSNQRARYLLGR